MPESLTITEFCRQHRISRQTFYNWARAGEAPEVVKISGAPRIFADAVVKWRQSMSKSVYYGTSSLSPCD